VSVFLHASYITTGEKSFGKRDFVRYFLNPYVRSPLIRSTVIMSNATRLYNVYGTVLHASKPFVSIHLAEELLQGARNTGCVSSSFSTVNSCRFQSSLWSCIQLKNQSREGSGKIPPDITFIRKTPVIIIHNQPLINFWFLQRVVLGEGKILEEVIKLTCLLEIFPVVKVLL
jgi:hypothetical protein